MAGKSQFALFEDQAVLASAARARISHEPLRGQLLKWVGNKQRFARDIVALFPPRFNSYFDPFLGAGAVLATVAPSRGFGSDSFKPLLEIWTALKYQPGVLVGWYTERYKQFAAGEATIEYERIKASYNARPNGADLVFLCRSCYGGVVRFRQADGYMSTPCGVHRPISPARFAERVHVWSGRITATEFEVLEFEEAMSRAKRGDLVYCDPPYSHTQSILYGAQNFSLHRLLNVIEACKSRGVYVALSIDGTKKSGNYICDLPIPRGLFAREVFLDCGRSMLRRFQMKQLTLDTEVVADRLLLTY